MYRIRENNGRWLIEQANYVSPPGTLGFKTEWQTIVTHHRTESSAVEHLAHIRGDTF